jgi:inorganic pyrophosphatase
MRIVVNGVRRPRPTQGCRADDDDDDDNVIVVMISADNDFYYKKVIILKLQKHLLDLVQHHEVCGGSGGVA